MSKDYENFCSSFV